MAHTDLLGIAAAVACASAGPSHAQMTWFVDDDAAPGGDGLSWATAFADLQPAMELGLPGDQIWVAEGVYVPSVIDPIAGEDQPYFLMPDGAALLGGFRGDETSADQRDPEVYESVISGDLLGNDLDVPVTGQVGVTPGMQELADSKLDNTGTLLFVDGTGPGTIIDGLVFEDAFTDDVDFTLGVSPKTRNGVFVLGSIVDFSRCSFRDNLGSVGGALYVYPCGPDVRYSGSFPSGEACAGVGVGLPSAVVIRDCAFLDNYANFGGSTQILTSAVRLANSVALIERATFKFSRVLSELGPNAVAGAGLLVGDGSDAVVVDSLFRRCSPLPIISNAVSAIGVGVVHRPGEPLAVARIDSCVFEQNAAPRFGVVRFLGGSGTISRSVFLGNKRLESAGFLGGSVGSAIGAVLPLSSPSPPFLSVTDSLFVGNGGGGLFATPAPVVATAIRQGTIARNTFVANETDGRTVLLFNPDLNDTTAEDILIVGESPMLDPLFVRNPSDGGDGFGDNPLTLSVDESLNDDYGDLRLCAGSPAIDAGATFFDNDFILDLGGNDRYADDPGIPGVFVDLGAYEFQGVTCLPDVNQDGVASPADFNSWISAYNDRSSLADQNRDGAITPADFNAWIMNYNAGCD